MKEKSAKVSFLHKTVTVIFLHAETHESAIEKQHKTKYILGHNEIIRFEDTGHFKVGDGKTLIEDLPFSNTLPEEMIIYKKQE